MAPVPAATVMIMDTQNQPPRFLMVHRNPALKVQGNAWVFPGGRLADVDQQNAAEVSALRACAVRETREEAGLRLDPATLMRVVRWVTPEAVAKRFDTWFYIAPLANLQAVRVDGSEIIDHRWLSADEALNQQHQGEIRLSPPAFVMLSWMAALGSTQAILNHFQKRAAEEIYFKPRLVPIPDGACNLFQEDVAYRSGDLDRPGPRHRLWMRASGYRYEGNPF